MKRIGRMTPEELQTFLWHLSSDERCEVFGRARGKLGERLLQMGRAGQLSRPPGCDREETEADLKKRIMALVLACDIARPEEQ